MTPLPIADWLTSLAGMEAALATTLAALDRYEAGWPGLLEGPAAPPAGWAADPVFARMEHRQREWDTRLAAAADLAAAVDRQLTAGETAVGRWQAVFTSWRDVIERGVGPAAPGDAPPVISAARTE